MSKCNCLQKTKIKIIMILVYYVPQPTHSLYVLTPCLTLSSKPEVPQSRLDQISLERNLATKIMEAFGIPESIFAPHAISGPRSKSASGNVSTGSSSWGPGLGTSGGQSGIGSYSQQILMQIYASESTLDAYRSCFKDTMIEIYEYIFKTRLDSQRVLFTKPDLYYNYLQVLNSNMRSQKLCSMIAPHIAGAQLRNIEMTSSTTPNPLPMENMKEGEKNQTNNETENMDTSEEKENKKTNEEKDKKKTSAYYF